MKSTMERLQAKSEARAAIVDQIARMLWESGEMLAETEGGSLPSWGEITDARRSGSEDEFTSACWSWWLDHAHKAEAILALDARQSLALAKILIDSAAVQQTQMELDLWRKIERAKGFEPGSLTGAPGVKQQVAL